VAAQTTRRPASLGKSHFLGDGLMEHRTALALAGAVVMVGASGAVVVGTVTGAVGPSLDEVRPLSLPNAGARAAEPGQAGQRRPTDGGRPAVQRVTRYVDVPVPAPGAQPASAVGPPLAGAAPAPPSAAGAVPERAPLAGATGDAFAEASAEGREERSEYEEELREERSDRLEDARDERQDRLEDLTEDDSGHGGDGGDGGDSGHGGHGHG
jgi:hypothetical protein